MRCPTGHEQQVSSKEHGFHHQALQTRHLSCRHQRCHWLQVLVLVQVYVDSDAGPGLLLRIGIQMVGHVVSRTRCYSKQLYLRPPEYTLVC
jgi:hypothetical protein